MPKTERPRAILKNCFREKVQESVPCSPAKFNTSEYGISEGSLLFKTGKPGHIRNFSENFNKRSSFDRPSSRGEDRAKTSKIFSD
jgi:hypothetical protein